jgi:hypothetical protein
VVVVLVLLVVLVVVLVLVLVLLLLLVAAPWLHMRGRHVQLRCGFGVQELHCSASAAYSFTNARVLIAEVLEWQGRHKEAIRCENINLLFRSSKHVCDVLLPVES